ncbi:MAG: hypothetical protein Q8N99_07245 [Nanoarchaeota archaeon]|nr:hypothetical protein [Nanoarchaeota archaeon]
MIVTKKRAEPRAGLYRWGELWWRYYHNDLDILFLRKNKREDGFRQEEAEAIAPQIEKASYSSRYYSELQHVLIRCRGCRFYIEINSAGDVRLPLVPGANGEKITYGRTDNPLEILGFRTARDWRI